MATENNSSSGSLQPSRRQILQSGMVVGAGLVVGFSWPRGIARAASAATGEQAFNAFVRIAADNSVTVIAKHLEFGQGTYTGLATLLAEELDADWSQIRVEAAPADATRYNNLAFGPVQGTGGSTAMANSWQQLRQAGATARAMLIAAAAAEWGVAASELTAVEGRIVHAASERSATFGELAEQAARAQPPENIELKDPARFKLIGGHVPRVDVPAKTRGTAQFTIDVEMPGLLTAVIARPPRFGGKVASFDASVAKKVNGVVDVVEVPAGVAVLAKHFWAAKKGRDALRIDWDDRAAEKRGSRQLIAEYKALAAQPGAVFRKEGDVDTALAGASKILEAEYEFPYLAHAPMEPLDCVVKLGSDGCEVWAGSQLQTVDQGVIAATVGLPPEKVQIHTLLGGGSFGRRATPNGDVAGEAASIAKAIGGKAPVKLLWTREDDLRGGRYRPLYVHRLKAGLDAAGNLVGWHQRIVGQSILVGTPFEAFLVKDGIDRSSIEGAVGLPYAIANLQMELHTPSVGVPVLWWRSVGHTHNGYSTETFLDQIAAAAGRDPVAMRRALLAGHPRHLGVLNLAVEKAGWGTPLPAGKARGVAVHESFASFVAQVVEISLDDAGLPVVERVVCAVDCGIAINPDNIRAQMEGGIGYGLGAALHNEVVIEDGRVVPSNFHDYPPLRLHEMPRVEVHIVPSSEAPTGVGEPGVPPIAPAVANAYLQLTGKPVHRLPFSKLSA